MPQHHSNSALLPQRDPEFEHSWQRLLASGREIIDLAASGHFPECRTLLHTREQHSHCHFAQFPVGPENRGRYRLRLCELFRQEQDIDRIKSELQDRTRGTSPPLRLVR